MADLFAKYKITSNSGRMPNQIYGEISDGRFFYFRGDDGYATLHINTSTDAALDDYCDDIFVWTGDNEQYGYMDPDEFEGRFWSVILQLEQ